MSDDSTKTTTIGYWADKLSYLEQPIKDNDKNVCNDKTIQLLSNKFDAKANYPAIK